MGKGGALSEGVLRNILRSYAYIGIWILLSFIVIVFNKCILDRKLYGWPYPISLTLMPMSFCSARAFLLIKVFHFVKHVSMSRDLFLNSVVPNGALYSLSLRLSNSAYRYLVVSFIQMLKALMPIIVYCLGVTLKRDAFNMKTMLNMLSISLGVAVAAYGEAKFDVSGITFQLGALIFEATSLIMIQILQTSNGINLNPVTSLYSVAPCCFVFLLVPWVFVEYTALRDNSSFRLDLWVFVAGN